MNRKEPTSRVIIKFVIAIIIAIYVLFPFALVLINSCKATADITSNPIGFNGASFGQLLTNLDSVVNNPNFLFWHAFGFSVLITVLSLVLLALFGCSAFFQFLRDNKIEFIFNEGWEWLAENVWTISNIMFILISAGLIAVGLGAFRSRAGEKNVKM